MDAFFRVALILAMLAHSAARFDGRAFLGSLTIACLSSCRLKTWCSKAMDTPKSYAARDYLQHCEHVLRVLGAPAGENLATVVAVLASMSFCCFSC